MTSENEKTKTRIRRRLSMNGLYKNQGTGSKPPGFHGWQRDMRLRPRQAPLHAPYFSTASAVYSEQLGKNGSGSPERADRVFVETDQCQQQQFHRLIVQVRSFCQQAPDFFGQDSPVQCTGLVARRKMKSREGNRQRIRRKFSRPAPDQISVDRPFAKAVWRRPAQTGADLLLLPLEGGNVTGNVLLLSAFLKPKTDENSSVLVSRYAFRESRR
jgi:hypothetical protein